MQCVKKLSLGQILIVVAAAIESVQINTDNKTYNNGWNKAEQGKCSYRYRGTRLLIDPYCQCKTSHCTSNL